MSLIKQLHTPARLYLAMMVLALLFICGFFLGTVMLAAKIFSIAFVILLFGDLSLIYLQKKKTPLLQRELPDKLSNGDDNPIHLRIVNPHPFSIKAEIIDDIPYQFQLRNQSTTLWLRAGEEKTISYSLNPKTRGEYVFGFTNVIYTSKIGLLGRHLKFGSETIVPVYPSFIQLKNFEFMAISNQLTESGIKRVRRSGMHNEFDRIKEYVKGDNYRTINWKTTAKKGKLMVNLYQEERSQRVYSIIDMGRTMEMPFKGMSLLDYAINASLILSNAAIKKHDKAGLFAFNTQTETFFRAERKSDTMKCILEHLYRAKTNFLESNYASMVSGVLKNISTRSLLLIYTNFESLNSLQRNMKYFKLLSRHHLILMVIFENSDIKGMIRHDVRSLEKIYTNTIAEKYIHDKKLIAAELRKNGILSVYTNPENLTSNLLNKYLELKSSGKF